MHQPSARRMPKCHPVLLLGRASKTPQALGDFKITDPWINNTWQRLIVVVSATARATRDILELSGCWAQILARGPTPASGSEVLACCARWYFAWCFWELGPSRPKASHLSELARA